jgi:hypothetical protein
MPYFSSINSHKKPRALSRLQLTSLEDRTVPALFTVTNGNDAGVGSLRDAINSANANAETDIITFGVEVSTVTLTTGGLSLTKADLVTIDARFFFGVTIERAATAPDFGILTVEPNAKADLIGLTLTNGKTIFGGGLTVGGGATVNLTNSTLSGNKTTDGGGIANFGTLTLTNSIVNQNSATADGGGIANFGTLTLTNSRVNENSANIGGGIYNKATATLTNSIVGGNKAIDFGGGIRNENGTVNLTNSLVANNNADFGGGIGNFAGKLTLANSTVSGNSATNNGGGLDNFGVGSVVTVTNSTITANRSDSDGNNIGTGGGIGTFGGVVSLFNTIVAGNFKGIGTNADEVFGILAATSTNNLIGGDAKLAPLALNGGPTLTHMLLVGSPAINAGDNAKIPAGITTDQRGLLRSFGSNVDIGAVELFQSSVPLVVDTGTDNFDGDFSAGKLSLREAVLIANDRAGADTITFAPGVTTATLTLGQLRLTDTASTTIDGGNGVTITRDGTSPEFRIMLVDFGAKADLFALGLNNGKFTGTASSISGTFDSDGAGLYISSGATVTLTNSFISGNGNNSTKFGGGIYNEGTMTLTKSTVFDNFSVSGGGIFNGGALTLTNATISGNEAKNAGGGLFNLGALTLTNATLTNSTVTANRSDADADAIGFGGGIAIDGGIVTMFNTIVAGNFNNIPTAGDDLGGAIAAASKNNLIGVDTGLTGITNTNGNRIGTAAAPLDARLAPLAFNGGLTPTHALLPNSQAINVGNKLADLPTTDQRGLVRISGSNVDIGAYEAISEGLIGSKQFAVGSGFGGKTATLFNADKSVRFTITPFPNSTGGVRVAVADFDQDGIGDLVVGTGPGVPTEVQVINGATQAVMFTINPFEAAFTGGVFIAAGSLSGTAGADLAISPDEGGGPRVRIFGGIGSGKSFQVADFFGIEDPNFRGGARVTMGDINGDGNADLVVAAGFGGGPRIAVFSGASFLVDPDRPVKIINDFFAFETALRNGTFVAAGDLDGDGKAEIITGAGPGGGPRVSSFNGADLVQEKVTRVVDYFAGDINNRDGVRPAIKDLDNDAQADIITGSGQQGLGRASFFSGRALVINPTQPDELFGLDTDNTNTAGIFVG